MRSKPNGGGGGDGNRRPPNSNINLNSQKAASSSASGHASLPNILPAHQAHQLSTNPLSVQRIMGPSLNAQLPVQGDYELFSSSFFLGHGFPTQQGSAVPQTPQTAPRNAFTLNANADDQLVGQGQLDGQFLSSYGRVEPTDDGLQRTEGSQQNHMFWGDGFLKPGTSSTQGLAPTKLKVPFIHKPGHDLRSGSVVPAASKISAHSGAARRSSQRIAEQAGRRKQTHAQAQARALGQRQGQLTASYMARSSGSRAQARRVTPDQTPASPCGRWYGSRRQTPSGHGAFPNTLQEYGQQLRRTKCLECRSPLIPSENDLMSLKVDSIGPYQPHPFIACQKCRMTACIGCGMTLGVSSNLTPPAPKWPAHVSECDGGWLFVFWLLLCRDPNAPTAQVTAAELANAHSTSQSVNSRTILQNMSAFDKGVGYSGSAQDDLAFATIAQEFMDDENPLDDDDDYEDDEDDERDEVDKSGANSNNNSTGHKVQLPMNQPSGLPPQLNSIFKYGPPPPLLGPGLPIPFDSVRQGMKLKKAERARKDESVAKALERLNELLLAAGRYPRVMLQMFLRSPLLQEVAEMLRNDSIDDITSRHATYSAIFRFIRRLQSQPDLMCLVYSGRPGLKHHQDLFHATFHPVVEAVPWDYEPLQPLWTSVRALVKPAEQMLSFLKTNHHIFKGEAGDYLSVCEAIKRTATRASSQENGTSEEQKEPDVTMTNAAASEDQKHSELVAWHKQHAVDEVDDALLISMHALGDKASRMGAFASTPGRMKRLMSEVTTLATSLPEGIYIRHGSSRLDLMKIIITGPRDTPYENGLFEFDLLCPANYPKEPPEVKFQTTGGGLRFNPNLYPDGKVCLSLLGTWAGEAWRPEASTILQVLVSIQSMIFCSEPWYNEPGRELHKEPERSQQYNLSVRSWTVKVAIEAWLQQRGHRIWGDVIDRHFRASSNVILATAEQWAQEKAVRPREGTMVYGRASPWKVEDLRKKLKAYLNREEVVPSMPSIWTAMSGK